MKHVVAGTAGHIDHGKTSLVRALTGIDTDRLKEEKQRGISIDLGFAHLDLSPSLRLAIVDVPGHERFVKNMLAGTGGVDLALLIVAANESIMPQTREHFDICRLLGITRGLVVLTKSDLVDPEIIELVKLEVEEFVRGSFLEGAPIVPVSSITGYGLHELRQSLLSLASSVPPRASNRYFRLPLDRAFSLHGFGTVATGTLSSGSVATGEEVEIHPSLATARVRGIQVHGESQDRASAGQRTALNLTGVDAASLRRGMTLAAPGRFLSTQVIDCAFDLLPSAKPLKHHAPVHFHSGTAEVEASLRRIGSAAALQPGRRAHVRLRLRQPLLLLPGDRFIVRLFSPVVTIGGGVVLDIAPPRKAASERLAILENAIASENHSAHIALHVSESPHGLSLAAIATRTGLRQEDAASAARDLALPGSSQPWFVDPSWLAAKLHDALTLLAQFHARNPLLPGMPREDLRSALLPKAPAHLFEALLAQTPAITMDGDTLRLPGHHISLRDEEEDAIGRIEAAFRDAALAVPSTDEVLRASGVEAARARTLLEMLLRQRRLVRVGAGLVFHSSALDALGALLAQHRGASFQVADFKEWTGVSRKYAIPLLEFLDRQRLTRREGETRIVL